MLTSPNSIELSVLGDVSKLGGILNGSSLMSLNSLNSLNSSSVVSLVVGLTNSTSSCSTTHPLVQHHHPLLVVNPGTSLDHLLVDNHGLVVHLVHLVVHLVCHLPPPPLLLPTPRCLAATPRATLPLPAIKRCVNMQQHVVNWRPIGQQEVQGGPLDPDF